MLVRLVLAILLAAFVCWLFSVLRARLLKKAVSNENGKIVACSYCSLYVPLEESIFRSERPYCSAKHADLGPIK
jgi:hypothetical protein